MSDSLDQFINHARTMAAPGSHQPDCHHTTGRGWGFERTTHPNPNCPGCVTDTDRELWARLADEADQHRARNTDQALL